MILTSNNHIDNPFVGKRILVTGGTGSIGSEIVRQVLKFDPEVVRIFSRDETKQFFLQDELREKNNVRFLIGDIRDKDRIEMAMEGIDIVFHAAALKHVPACEYNPFEAVETNVRGTQNVIRAAIHNNVEKMVVISTDKSVNPTNVMGATKLLAERLVTSAQFSMGKHKTVFSCVRFGNVLGSRGSVLTLFEKQIKNGEQVTITDPDMTRFFMLIPESVSLVFEAMKKMQGGEVFILKMPTARLGEFVQASIEELAPRCGRNASDIGTKIVGIRPGEKMDEELMTSDEALKAHELDNMFIVLPAIMNPYANYEPYHYEGAVTAAPRPYLSSDQRLMTKDEIRSMIRSSYN